MDKCPICGGAVRFLAALYDDRYGYPGEFRLAGCPACGHKSLRTSIPPESLPELYLSRYPRSSFRLEDYRPCREICGFRGWLDGERCSAYAWVPKAVRILDIGCGFGETLGYHKARGCEVYGVEADENIRRVAERYGFDVRVGLFDPSLYERDSFDYVTMDQVIEHMSDPVEALRGVARVLNPGGTAILSTPNADGWGARLFGRRWIHWHAPYHLHFFSGRSMSIAAERAGMNLERIRNITSSEWLFYQWVHLATCPPVGTPSPFWSLQGTGKSPRSPIVFLLRILHRTKANHLLTRLFDRLGVGDNRLYFLRKT